MQGYASIFERIPAELRGPLAELVDAMDSRISEMAVTRHDFNRLENAVADLAQAQRRTEQRVEELAQAQQRTEERLDRLEAVVEKLAEAQQRAEERLGRLEAAVEKLARAQYGFENTFQSQIGALGARWGMRTETAFRKAMRGILGDLGFQVDRYLKRDIEGLVFGHPDQIEVDVVIRDGQTFLIEIKSSMNKSDVYTFERKIQFYEKKEGQAVSRKLIVSPFVEPSAVEVAGRLGMEVFTDINEVA